MFNTQRLFTLKSSLSALVLVLVALQAQASDSLSQRLQQADSYRLSEASTKVITEVVLFKNNQQTQRHRYHVYVRPQRESLVVFKSAAEAGQKMLMLGDKYWLLMPNSRRPIRITPMQKLLGEASVGDVSTLTWSEDYQGDVKELSEWQGQQVRRLALKAKTAGASYQRIDLWVDEQSNFPLKADLYLHSGKLAKHAEFQAGQRQHRTAVVSMRLDDAIQSNQSTIIYYQSLSAHQLPSKYYNPAYLSRQSVTHL